MRPFGYWWFLFRSGESSRSPKSKVRKQGKMASNGGKAQSTTAKMETKADGREGESQKRGRGRPPKVLSEKKESTRLENFLKKGSMKFDVTYGAGNRATFPPKGKHENEPDKKERGSAGEGQ